MLSLFTISRYEIYRENVNETALEDWFKAQGHSMNEEKAS